MVTALINKLKTQCIFLYIENRVKDVTMNDCAQF